MLTRNQKPAGRRTAMKGFTIVEMAVVLVIIGVILGAVMIGRDAQRNAEYVRIRQTFVNQWAQAYNAYVQRMGVPFGDDPSVPRLMVNGAAFAGSGISTSGGDMSSATEPPAICERNAGPNMGRAMQPSVSLRTLMLRAGIELPQGRGVGQEDRYCCRSPRTDPLDSLTPTQN